jgi:hypothetical protein
MKNFCMILTLSILASTGCRQRQNSESEAKADPDSETTSAIMGSEVANAAVCGSLVNEVKVISGKSISDAAKFAAASIEQTGASIDANDQELWFVLLGTRPEANASVYSVDPRITVSFRGWPTSGIKYAVSDDCYEPRRSDSQVAVCGQLQVTSGEVVYTKVPDRRGGEVHMEFDFTDAQGQNYSGIAQACVNPPLVATLDQ